MREKLKFFIGEYEELKRLAKRLHNYNVKACNYGLSKRQEKLRENAEKKVREIVERINKTLGTNFKPYFQGDPRGLPLFLVDDDCKYTLGDHEYYDYHKGIVIYL